MNDKVKPAVQQLTSKIKSGEYGRAFELQPLIGATIRYIALKYLHNEDDANEVVQDFWADIFDIVKAYHFTQSAYSYFCKVARKRAIDMYMTLHKNKKVTVEYVRYSEIFYYGVSNKKDVDTIIAVEQGLEKLEPLQRIIVQTMYFEDKSLCAIGKELGISAYEVRRARDIAFSKLGRLLDQ